MFTIKVTLLVIFCVPEKMKTFLSSNRFLYFIILKKEQIELRGIKPVHLHLFTSNKMFYMSYLDLESERACK